MKINRFLLAAALLFANIQVFSQTVSCNGYNPWVATQTYNNETVFHDGILYQAQWNSYNLSPSSNNGSGQPWHSVGTCATPIIPKTVSCVSVQAWSSTATYNSGDKVTYGGYQYEATYWSQTTPNPAVNGESGPWRLLGSCQAPASLTVTGTLTTFTTTVSTTSAVQSFTVSGANLTGALTVTAPANFEVSLSSGTGFGSSVTITPQSGTVSNVTVYVVYTPVAIGNDTGTLVISGGGVTAQNIAVSGTATGLWIVNGNNIYNGNSGNVGIGTGSNPTLGKLHVNGTSYLNGNVTVLGETRFSGKIATTEVFVTSTPLTSAFPDYVFDKNYPLLSLDSLSAYISRNKHLPEVPSAKEVAEQGQINLGQMNSVLLKKVEELTLYVIDQQKSAKQQQVLLDELLKERAQMEARLKQLENSAQ